MRGAYDEIREAAEHVLGLVRRYQVAIQAGDATTRTTVPHGDGSHASGRLVEAATLAAARAWANSTSYAGPPDANVDQRADWVEHEARRVAARTEFRAAVEAVVKTILVRQA